MTENKNFIIGLLSVTSVMLFCTLVLLSRTAEASSTPDKGGDYSMVGGKVNSNNEAIYVLDIGVRKLGWYQLSQTRTLQLVKVVDLAAAMKLDAPR